MTPGEQAYAEDLQAHPVYRLSGKPRPTWTELEPQVRGAWEAYADRKIVRKLYAP